MKPLSMLRIPQPSSPKASLLYLLSLMGAIFIVTFVLCIEQDENKISRCSVCIKHLGVVWSIRKIILGFAWIVILY